MLALASPSKITGPQHRVEVRACWGQEKQLKAGSAKAYGFDGWWMVGRKEGRRELVAD
jgi:hypothetical protein